MDRIITSNHITVSNHIRKRFQDLLQGNIGLINLMRLGGVLAALLESKRLAVNDLGGVSNHANQPLPQPSHIVPAHVMHPPAVTILNIQSSNAVNKLCP
ncbi:uncharacterized protein EKO05_0005937 [Ascochyta rabiei]|uniref:uncharacterized protein n=1 Tax=Didymella rabiei TaxID=5454 RepID=UPI002206CFEC|nr:uncharacterized protein EKO05_0005937 [Ascochyta rabiei]UPX15491.1 hypothetical protein EKO05_0005937 [Ascochyta rabiei]